MPSNIAPPTSPSEEYTLLLNDFQLKARFTYLTRTSSWVISVFDVEGNALISGVRLVPWTFLFRQHRNEIGDLLLINKEAVPYSSDEEPTPENFSTKFDLVYFTAEEMDGVFL